MWFPWRHDTPVREPFFRLRLPGEWKRLYLEDWHRRFDPPHQRRSKCPA
jgi:hypothetical protein